MRLYKFNHFTNYSGDEAQHLHKGQLSTDELQPIHRLREHPELMQRFRTILEITGNTDGPMKQADEVEALLIEQMRRLGNASLESWASRAEKTLGEQFKQKEPAAVVQRSCPPHRQHLTHHSPCIPHEPRSPPITVLCAPAVYKCPSDKSYVLIGGREHLRVRSYAMNEYLGCFQDSVGQVYQPYYAFLNLSDFEAHGAPARTFVFLDVHGQHRAGLL